MKTLKGLEHASRIDQIEAAARVLGGHMDVNVQFDEEPEVGRKQIDVEAETWDCITVAIGAFVKSV